MRGGHVVDSTTRRIVRVNAPAASPKRAGTTEMTDYVDRGRADAVAALCGGTWRGGRPSALRLTPNDSRSSPARRTVTYDQISYLVISQERATSRSREARILDAAGELLLVFGYRRVTVDDVARRAEVGKGTVYLHWSSKLELFAAVLLREVGQLVAEQLVRMRADPAEIRLHRTLRRMFLLVMRRPLARAFYTGDSELLGALLTDTKIGLRFAAQKAAMGAPYLTVLHEHGLLADDPAAESGLAYRLSAATAGFFLLERMLQAGVDVDLEAKADGLAQVVRRAFEPAGEPDPDELAAAAAAVVELYEHLLAELTGALPEEEQ